MRYTHNGFGIAYYFEPSDYEQVRPIVKTVKDANIGAKMYVVSDKGKIGHLELIPEHLLDSSDEELDEFYESGRTRHLNILQALDYYCGRENVNHPYLKDYKRYVIYIEMDLYQSDAAEATILTKSKYTAVTIMKDLNNIVTTLVKCGIPESAIEFVHYTSEWCVGRNSDLRISSYFIKKI